MRLFAICMAVCLASAAMAQTTLKPDLGGLGFLVGHWSNGVGKVADIGGTSKGSSVISVEANGEALLRRDHTDVFDARGKPAESFDQIMLIYPEGGTIRADYTDGRHVIHYPAATVISGKSATFTSARQAGAPVYRLTYDLQATDTLAVSFAMMPPGQSSFIPIATGTLKREP
jgi:hypothetical protein